jgi:hypothetical protein
MTYIFHQIHVGRPGQDHPTSCGEYNNKTDAFAAGNTFVTCPKCLEIVAAKRVIQHTKMTNVLDWEDIIEAKYKIHPLRADQGHMLEQSTPTKKKGAF